MFSSALTTLSCLSLLTLASSAHGRLQGDPHIHRYKTMKTDDAWSALHGSRKIQADSLEISCDQAIAEVVKLPKISQTPVQFPLDNGLKRSGVMYLIKHQDIVSYHIIHSGSWQQEEVTQLVWALNQTLPDGYPSTELFVDIGSNVGWFSLNMAARGYRVEAFEAMPQNQLILKATMCSNIEISSRMILHAHGLGPEDKTCYIFAPSKNQGNGRSDCISTSEQEALAKQRLAAPSNAAGGYDYKGEMKIHRLDSIISSDIKALKIDVEGYEPFVFQGASLIFTRHRVWYMVMELNNRGLREIGLTSSFAFSRYIVSLGFRVSLTGFRGPFEDFSSREGVEAFRRRLSEAPCGRPGIPSCGITDLYCVNELAFY